MAPNHRGEYDVVTTDLCERVLVTLLGDIGTWSERVVLVGGLAPRYIIGSSPSVAVPHVGATDVDLVVELAVGESNESYGTLHKNLKHWGFAQSRSSYKWRRRVEGATIEVDFLCESDQVEPGRIHMPKDGTGAKFGAFNTPGASLVAQDFIETSVTADRLDGGGISICCERDSRLLSTMDRLRTRVS